MPMCAKKPAQLTHFVDFSVEPHVPAGFEIFQHDPKEMLEWKQERFALLGASIVTSTKIPHGACATVLDFLLQQQQYLKQVKTHVGKMIHIILFSGTFYTPIAKPQDLYVRALYWASTQGKAAEWVDTVYRWNKNKFTDNVSFALYTPKYISPRT